MFLGFGSAIPLGSEASGRYITKFSAASVPMCSTVSSLLTLCSTETPVICRISETQGSASALEQGLGPSMALSAVAVLGGKGFGNLDSFSLW